MTLFWQYNKGILIGAVNAGQASPTSGSRLALLKTYRAMAEPKVVVAVGTCGISGGIFGKNYATVGEVDKVVPVDVYIPGCPPRPQSLLHGILLAIGRLAGKSLRE